MKRTNSRQVLLSSALQRDDGTLELPSNLKGGAAQKVVTKLLTDGLAEEIPARGTMPAWRKEEESPIALRITQAGLAVVQAGDAAAGSTSPPGMRSERARQVIGPVTANKRRSGTERRLKVQNIRNLDFATSRTPGSRGSESQMS